MAELFSFLASCIQFDLIIVHVFVKSEIPVLSSLIVIGAIVMRNIVRVHRGTMALWESPKIKTVCACYSPLLLCLFCSQRFQIDRHDTVNTFFLLYCMYSKSSILHLPSGYMRAGCVYFVKHTRSEKCQYTYHT